jgi:hydroxypyruvate reductase
MSTINGEKLRETNQTLKNNSWGNNVIQILSAALHAVDPYYAAKSHLQREGDRLIVDKIEYDLNDFDRIFIVGAGKASLPMASATLNLLGDDLTGGIIIANDTQQKHDPPLEQDLSTKIDVYTANHPIPDIRGVEATKKIVTLLSNTDEKDLIICLISGGGSALLTYPRNGLTLSDIQDMTNRLLACGASINEINTIRKHLDNVKGGGLARYADPSTIISLILSDVVGDPLDIIASGPTAPDPTTYKDARNIVSKYHLDMQVAPGIIHHLDLGIQCRIQDNPKDGDPLFSRSQNLIIGNNHRAASAAQKQATELGFNAMILTTSLQGEARHVGRVLASIAREIDNYGLPLQRPACIITGGETTVTIQGDGLGGRNQEVALGAVNDIANIQDVAVVTLATDGVDGSTDAGGAVITGDTYSRAAEINISPDEYLANNDSYNFFKQLGDLIITGPTQTNVSDLAFVFVF